MVEPLCDPQALTIANHIVSDAIATWGLSQRVRRLSLHALHYQPIDFQYMRFLLARDASGYEVGLAALEIEQGSDVLVEMDSVLLHGLFVVENCQRLGIGRVLLDHCVNWARNKGLSRITVRPWTSAENFFLNYGFIPDKENEKVQVVFNLSLSPK